MKSTSVLLLAFLMSLNCFSQDQEKLDAQSLEGDWQGSFTSLNPDPYAQLPFANGGFFNLKFILNKDNSYTVYSYYKGSDTTNVFEVLYKRLSEDSILLQETKIIKPQNDPMLKCLLKNQLNWPEDLISFPEAIAACCSLSQTLELLIFIKNRNS
jgi:hypothetical protein